MANIRIKDLANTASSTASDDFIGIDGATNGTRKLSAFSPTFGGNATVTGTLTANGLLTAAATTSLDGLPTAAIFGATKRIAIGYNTSGDYGFVASADSGTTWKELHLNPVGGIVKVPNTSASTSTSSGALVVSGGLGVGKSLSVADGIGVGRYSAISGGSAKVDINGGGTAGLPQLMISDTTGRQWEFRGADASSSFILDFWNGAARTSNLLTISSGGNLGVLGTATINSTTASTSTSSGALVVSGGVGVAGKISAGGDVVAFNDSVFVSASTWVGRSDGTNASLYLRANGTGKVIVDTGTGGLDVSAGPIRTAAPSGGTAANWKLGSVASVSPTSPNRTIEVDIGGTIYYIHAKTTNN